ncbi:MAG: tryptophan--tRNA ligase [Candidatus Pacebacteria bacterium]|nr:tryptophan--tRNA ligase [Candidatus Paceibacterota bacterium]
MKIFSGIRPTGDIHIGNYIGSLKQWVEVQEKDDCFFCIVDWHAITTPYEASTLQKNIFDLAATYLAAGINPDKCIYFVQSQVKEHTELTWLLGTTIPVGELQRMTQFKDKSLKHKESVNAGLLNYPILMAADILLYNTQAVPIGKDQKQHLELTRDTAERFNNKYGKTFVIPEPMIPKQGATIMSLTDPEKKMSKSDNGKGSISLFENPDLIMQKLMSATTDSNNEIKFDVENKKGISNLLTIYSVFSGKPIKKIEEEFTGKGYGDFKSATAEILIESLKPIREKKKEYEKNPDYVWKELEKGADKARKIAEETMKIVRKNMGLK